jgi:hypothetical protein
MEIGNNVFMEFIKRESGFEKLSQRNVDFGGGLERLAAAAQKNPDVSLPLMCSKRSSIFSNISPGNRIRIPILDTSDPSE